MKKIAIAGASVALAAMPVVGVFAETTGTTAYTDYIQANVQATCSFARGNKGAASSSHANGTTVTDTGAWTTDPGDAGANPVIPPRPDLLSGNVTAGQVYTDYGSSNFTVTCNNLEGWNVTATATDLDATGETNNIDLGTPTSGISAWDYTSSSNEGTGEGAYSFSNLGNYHAASQIVASGTAATGNNGVSFKMTYGLSVGYDIHENTYKGSISYTLAEVPAANQGD